MGCPHSMGRMMKKQKTKSWVEIFHSERKQFPQGYCVTRVIPDKRNKKPKYKKGWNE